MEKEIYTFSLLRRVGLLSDTFSTEEKCGSYEYILVW